MLEAAGKLVDHSSFESDFDLEYRDESLILLDNNGFPSFHHISHPDEDEIEVVDSDCGRGNGDAEGNNQCKKAQDSFSDECTREDEEQVEDGFAADFYRCGTDWSHLKVNHKHILQSDGEKSKRLKQTNLFRLWGIGNDQLNNKSQIHDSVTSNKSRNSDPGTSSSPSPSLTRFNARKRTFDLKDSNGRATNSKVRTCPFYKKIPGKWCFWCLEDENGWMCPAFNNATCSYSHKARRLAGCLCCLQIKVACYRAGTPFTVDAFKYGRVEGCTGYFLSHFHYDHYGGLSKQWTHGPIYCTPITARLVRMCLSVNPAFICSIEINVEHVIEGITVTLLEANHCPGAALIHLRLPNQQCYLHTGDFRACKLMQTYPLLMNQKVNVLYLDTTYCNPKYRFPSKDEVLNFIVKTTKNFLQKQPKTLVVVGAYSIGKECVYVAISEALGVKIFASTSRRRILQSFGWPELSGSLCSDGNVTPLHVIPISSLRHEALKNYLKTYQNQFTGVLAFRPTGWTFSESIGDQLDRIKPNCRGNVVVYGVPYSEHSSFIELKEFVEFLKPNKIIPTVNVGNAGIREKMQSYFREWMNH